MLQTATDPQLSNVPSRELSVFSDEKCDEKWDDKSKPVNGSKGKESLGRSYTTHLSDVQDIWDAQRNIICWVHRTRQWKGLCVRLWDLTSGIVSQRSGMQSRMMGGSNAGCTH
jgi:hypothetical protein